MVKSITTDGKTYHQRRQNLSVIMVHVQTNMKQPEKYVMQVLNANTSTTVYKTKGEISDNMTIT